MCNNKDLLVGYLYDDVTADERRAFDAHLRTCAECREELASLGMTRAHLATWAPPERALGFRMISDAPQTAPNVIPFSSRVGSVRKLMPAFGLAAAAVLVLAAATAIANLEIRYDNNGLMVRTGWARDAAQTAAAPAPGANTGIAQATWRADFDALERRLRDLETATTPATGVQLASTTRMSDAEVLRQVRAIVKEAESRQQVAVAQRLLQVMQDFERQRRTDLAMLQQGNAQYQGVTSAELAQTRDMLNQLVRASTRQEK
jgi:hypothetical protein